MLLAINDLTHRGLLAPQVSVNIGSSHDLVPVRCHAITRINGDLLTIDEQTSVIFDK